MLEQTGTPSFLACRCDWALHQIRILEKRDKHWRVSKTRTRARGMGNLITPDSHQVFTDRHRDCANGRITAFSETWAGLTTPKVQKCGKIGKSAPLLYKAEHLSRRKEKVPRDGIEPPTPAFSGPRSTD